jgi:hypothetical protein
MKQLAFALILLLHSQRQALISAICPGPYGGILRDPESQRRKQPVRNLLRSQVAAALRALPGKQQTNEHEKAVGAALWGASREAPPRLRRDSGQLTFNHFFVRLWKASSRFNP